MKIFSKAEQLEFMRQIEPALKALQDHAYQQGYEDGRALAIRDKLYKQAVRA